MKNLVAESLIRLAANIARTNSEENPNAITNFIMQAQRMAKTLHGRYEAECSYQWADTDKFRKQTLNLENKLQELADTIDIKIELQRDPRGWPLKVFIPREPGSTDLQEHRIGG